MSDTIKKHLQEFNQTSRMCLYRHYIGRIMHATRHESDNREKNLKSPRGHGGRRGPYLINTLYDVYNLQPTKMITVLMDETRRKPTTGRQSPSLFDEWHGSLYTDTAGHTKAFDYPVMGHWGESRSVQFREWDSNRQRIGTESKTLPTYSQPGSPSSYKNTFLINRTDCRKTGGNGGTQ